MTDENEEKVCVTKKQMDNILDADRAYARGEKKPKKECPKAWNWVTKYRPIKKTTEEEMIEKVGSRAVSKAIRKAKKGLKERLGALGDLI